MRKAATIFIFLVLNIFFMEDFAFASGVAAQRNRPAGVRPPSVSPQPQQQQPIQGPPVNLGPRKHTVYAPARQKSVNLPAVLPYETTEEVKKPAPPPAKKMEPTYTSQVLSSSSNRNNSGVMRPSSPPSRKPPASPASPEMAALFDRMDQSSELWLNLKDAQVKTLIVSHYVDLYQQFGVKINKTIPYYINLIDSMAQNNPRMLTHPFDQVLRVMAILEYDYDSGENKDALAASILTDHQAFLKNKQRLGLK